MGIFDALKTPTFWENYELGFPDIKGPQKLLLEFKQNELVLILSKGFSSRKLSFTPNDILEVGLNQEAYRSAGKAVTGAVIGGILTGGIGFLAGAAIGGKRRKEDQLHLIINYHNTACNIILTPSKNTSSIYNELKKFMSKQDLEPQQIKIDNENQKEDTHFDLVKELEKLHELLQKGILTQEEFDKQKSKILNG